MGTITSCLMLAVNLYTPVDLECIFDSEDLKDTGVELDSHITLVFAQGKLIPRKSLMSDIEEILGGDYDDFLDLCKTENFKDVLDIFDLGFFENDSDYIVLKLKKKTKLYEMLSRINLGLRNKYNIDSDFDEYVPHITLAELQPGTVKKYRNSEKLMEILKDTIIDFEDVMVSFGKLGAQDRKQYFLTQYKNVDRFFRINDLKEDRSEFNKFDEDGDETN